MINDTLAIARVEGKVSVVQVVQSNPTSSFVEIIKFAPFGGQSFMLNLMSSPPSKIPVTDVLQTLPSSVELSGGILTLPSEIFNQFVELCTANQHLIEAKWARAVQEGRFTVSHD